MEDKERKERKERKNTKANIPYPKEPNKHDSDSPCVIVEQQQRRNHQERLIERVASVNPPQGKEKVVKVRELTRTAPNGRRKTRPKKKPESANRKEIRLERNRRTAKARRDKQRAETDAKQQKIIEIANMNNSLRQNIQIRFQELIGLLGVVDDASTTSAIGEKIFLLASSFRCGTTATRCNTISLDTRSLDTRSLDARSLDTRSLDTRSPSASLLPARLPESNKALQLLLQQERNEQNPQLHADARLRCPRRPPQRPQRTQFNSNPSQQQLQQLICEQHQRLVKLISIRGQQLQQMVHSNEREQQVFDAQPQQLGKERQRISQEVDEIALGQRQKAPDYQGELNGIFCDEEQQIAGHRRQEIGERRQRIPNDEIALLQIREQEQRMIDCRRQQLRGEEEERRRMREDENTLSQDWQQVLGNVLQKMSDGFGCEEDQHQQRLNCQRQRQQMQDQEPDAKESNAIDFAQRLQEDHNHQQDADLNNVKDQSAILDQQQCGAGRQEREQQEAQSPNQDQVAVECEGRRQEQPGMEDELSLAQRNQLASFFQQQIDLI